MLNKLLMIFISLFCTKDYQAQDKKIFIEEKIEKELNTAISNANKIDKTINFLKSQPNKYKINKDKIEFAQLSIDLGKQDLKDIYNNNKEKIAKLTKDQNSYLDSILNINWALFAEAVQKNQGFTGGSIVIEDPNLYLYNYLFNYVKLVNADINAGKIQLKHISPNCYAYARHSSHFQEVANKAGFEQFGIDVRYSNIKDALALLPANKRHILFGRLEDIKGKTYIFIKMELYGLCKSDWSVAYHAIEYCKPKGGISRREDVPKAVIEKYKTLLKTLPKDESKKLQDKKLITIREIYAYLKNIIPDFIESKDLIKYLETNFDHLDVRRGNEVILTKADVLS